MRASAGIATPSSSTENIDDEYCPWNEETEPKDDGEDFLDVEIVWDVRKEIERPEERNIGTDLAITVQAANVANGLVRGRIPPPHIVVSFPTPRH